MSNKESGSRRQTKRVSGLSVHEKFYYEKLKQVRYQDVYHKALCYCLGISDDTRKNVNRIYEFRIRMCKNGMSERGLADQWEFKSS